MANRGRDFEKLVASIESAYAGTTAIIKQNDRIPDVETGKPREVDVSMRTVVGSMEFLTIVECRDRKQKANARWIEELDGKRKSVGAHKVVAVSRSGFTGEAIKKAKLRNIETRTLKKLKPSQIRKWLVARQMAVYHCRYTQLGGQVAFGKFDGMEEALAHDLEWVDEEGKALPIFERGLDGKRIYPFDVFRWAYWVEYGSDPEQGVTEEPVQRWIEIACEENELWVVGPSWRLPVVGVRMGFEIAMKQVPLGCIESYQREEKDLAHRVKWEDDIEYLGKSTPLSVEVTITEKKFD